MIKFTIKQVKAIWQNCCLGQGRARPCLGQFYRLQVNEYETDPYIL